MVRLKVNISEAQSFVRSKFQYLLVRLKENQVPALVRRTDKFQYLLVRLKVDVTSTGVTVGAEFQYLLVRLKESDLFNNWINSEISIPLGTIKRWKPTTMAYGKTDFNTSWYD